MEEKVEVSFKLAIGSVIGWIETICVEWLSEGGGVEEL